MIDRRPDLEVIDVSQNGLLSDMDTPQYSLRWNNHLVHMMDAIEVLLQNETLVDVTLVCEKTQFKAHKVVLSACSPYFQRLFSETPCKHPVIVLKDLPDWEMRAIIHFMYKGEINVGQEQLPLLLQAAETLQEPPHIRLPQIPHLPPITFNDRNCPSPTPRRKQARPRRRSGEAIGAQDLRKASSPSHFNNNVAENLSMKKSPNNENINNENMPTNLSCNNKRPDRTPSPSANKQMKVEVEEQEMIGDLGHSQPVELTANSGNPNVNNNNNNNQSSNKKNHHHHHHHNHHQQQQRHPDFPYYGPDPMSIPLNPHDPHFENSLFPPFGPLSSLSLQGPPHMFPIDAQFGLFPGLDGCRNPLLNELIEPRFDNPPPSKKKKKMFPVGRPKGQHSAPRGGPPRSWTNAELTEALQHVWNKKMTTSQASRIFGIPYNSLLMYVRGKYGKSLKLEQLKKECFGDINGPLDLLHFGSISNNNNSSNKNNNNSNSNSNNNNGGGHNGGSGNNNSGSNNNGNGNGNHNNNGSNNQSNGGNGPAAPSEPVDLMLGPPGFNPSAFPASNFFPDFGSTFPMGMDMIHLIQQQQQISLSEAEKQQYMGLDMMGVQPQSAVVLDYAMKSPAAIRSNSEPPMTGGGGEDETIDGDGMAVGLASLGDVDAECDDDDDDDDDEDEDEDEDGADDCGVDDEDDEDEDEPVAVDFSKAGSGGAGGAGGAGSSSAGGSGTGGDGDDVDDDERLSPEAEEKDKEQD
ncbi:protein jim lovell-like [Sipha flava]|uniref:Protein jim lovell-like n=1 Tax=Sipha flava TaxID=143950 RepID=A0A8B8FQ59_9HEMI|nr:protein jim lovell-like [Sipha flava]